MAKTKIIIHGEERPKKKIRKRDKVTWPMIFDDFKMRHPNSRDMISKMEPVDAGVARVFMVDGLVLLYYYDIKSTVPDYAYMERMRKDI